MSFGFPLVAVPSLVAAASLAHGATIFTTRASFDAAVFGADPMLVGGETWDSLPLGLLINDGDTINGLTYRYTPGYEGLSLAVTNALGTSAPHALGTYYAPGDYFSGVTPSDALTIEFDAPLNTFGLWVNTADLVAGAVTITTDTGEVAISGLDPFPDGNQYGQFVGLSTNIAFSSVTFTIRDGYTAAFDGFTWVNATVPTPGAGALAALGLTVASARRRR